jgi:hypothetical protein
VVSTTVLLLPEFLPDLVEDDAVVLSFNDRQIVVRTPRPRTLLSTTGASQLAPGWVTSTSHPDTARQVLRHTNHCTTWKHYTRTSSERRREAIEALDKLFNG